ncbi:F-box/LRR-repeat/kelch-repeat protein At1g09650-like [Salvia splendens]|uniref:F-box/LRR-repeat/kelch-repeat protein At1g09650-like n=1 Tax=Salvia splendens TaxID=180675 RepID=UPI001C26B6F5|nr:F-box/LRR-repeat/kelch-repeat protein At1g09650-like [Salvia splendens]
MVQDFFTNLPTEITTDILSRLSIRSYAISKSVCKAWLNLLDSDDFDKSKLKTPPALVRFNFTKRNSTRCTIFEIEDEDEADLESHDRHYNRLTDLEIPHRNITSMECVAANGLLLLYSPSPQYIPHVCNLITREYTELSYPEDYIPYRLLQLGFGVSKISGQYKVVWINPETGSDFHCVYTLGTGTWRRVQAGAASGFQFCGHPILCNDNLHWQVLLYDSTNFIWAFCGFDVETECFSIFPFPFPMGDGSGYLSVLRDYLCYSCYAHDDEIVNGEIVIWMMKEYLVVESWTIEYKISINELDLSFCRRYVFVEAIKLFRDGDVLMLVDRSILVYYSNKTRTLQQFDKYQDADAKVYNTAVIFYPSLLSLKNFGFENVISL